MADPTPPSALRRPWWRLHASTHVVLWLFVLAFVVLIVPGYDKAGYWHHGWPWTFRERGVSPRIHDRTGPHWLYFDSWFVERTHTLRLGNLAADVAVALTVT